MKIVVAADGFKGCLPSDEVGAIIARGLRESFEDAEIMVIPVADGGEGTTDAVIRATGGEIQTVEVTGPLGQPVTASFGLLPGGTKAVMEMASASGMELVPARSLNPMKASSFGTGELIRAVIQCGVRDLILGIGGSATVDGGMGMAQALGYRLLQADGTECGSGGEALTTVADIDSAGVVAELRECRIRVASDVTNPMTGERGAARVFGPQKGATPHMVELLDAGLRNLAGVWISEGMLSSVEEPGDGAAGGLGAGLRAFCGAEVLSGADLVAEITGFDREIIGADILVTGEGRTDEQTADGKLCAVLATKARKAGVGTVLISGALHGDLRTVEGLFDAVFAAVRDISTLDAAIQNGREDVALAARNVGRALAMGRSLGRLK